MKKMNNSLTSIKRIGISAFAAGAILFAGGNAVSADEGSEFGENLMYEGKSSEHVAELNELLADRDLLKSEADATYTAATTEAVIAFQKEHDLLVDGLAGAQTVGALSELSVGDNGYLVEELQKDLNDLGLYKYDIDGLFGPITEQAVKDFQAKYGIEQTGVAGPDTYAALYYGSNPAVAAKPAEETTEEVVEEE
ncbi:peptidoglycan-binding domain-containing protein, partial [Alkalicoccus daliensis]